MIFLIEFGVHDGVAASTIYVSTHGIASGPTDTPANKFYEPRLSSVGRLERSMFGNGDGVSGGTTGGASEVGFGNISVLNGQSSGVEELIDDWKDLAFREVTIKSLSNDAQPFSQAVTRFIGTVEQLVSTNALEQYDMIIHDRLENLNKPLLINKYLGTTNFGGLGTAEGVEDQKDQIKQKIWGTVHNVTCVDVNHFDLVWQVSDGQVLSITVYDGGVALTNAGDIGSIEALFAVSIQPGHYATCCALGLFRTGSSVQGTVTADVVEGTTASDRTAAQIVKRMLAWFADMYDETMSLSNSDVAALDALNSAECGILVKDTEDALTAIMRVLNSVGAWMLPQSNSLSMYEVGRFDPPDVLPVATYELNENIGGNPQRVESGDDGKGVPAWKVIVRYDQLDVVQKSSELFGVVTENDPIRVQYLATEWRQASAEDDTVLVQWPNAPTIQVDTRLMLQADAAAEANRLLALHGVKRDIWRIVVPMSDDPADDPGIGEVVELTSALGRMGLGPEPGLGQTFRCLGRVDDFDNVPLLTLTLWGPFGLPNIAAFRVVREPVAHIGEARFAGAGSLRADTVQHGRKFGAVAFAGAGSLRADAVIPVALDSSMAAWLAVVGAGNVSGDVNSGRQKLLNDLIIGLKADGVWALLDRLWIFAAANTASALVDLKGLVSATPVASPTHTPDRGYNGNGSTSYLNTNFNPATHGVNYVTHSEHLAIWCNTSRSVATNVAIGGLDGGGAENMLLIHQNVFPTSGLGFRFYDSFNNAYLANSSSQGFFIAQVTNSTTWQGYFNGASLGTFAVSANSRPNTTLFVCGRGDAGTLTNATNDQFSMASAGGKLTNTQATAFYNRLRTYMTAVGVP